MTKPEVACKPKVFCSKLRPVFVPYCGAEKFIECTLSDVLTVVKLLRMRWEYSTQENYESFVPNFSHKPAANWPLTRPKSRWAHNMKMDLK